MNENENITQGGDYRTVAPNDYNGPVRVSNAIPEKTGGKAVGSLVCGIISLVGFWTIGSIVLSIIGIVLGIVSIAQKSPNKGMAIAGIVTSVIGMLLSALLIFLAAMMMAAGVY